jgi:hypothetical protein
VKRLPIDNLSLAEVPKIDHRVSQGFECVVVSAIKIIDVRGTGYLQIE